MPYVPVRYQTRNQKRRNRGNTNIPTRYMTRRQKAGAGRGRRRTSRYGRTARYGNYRRRGYRRSYRRY